MGANGARVNNSGRLIYLDLVHGFCPYGDATAKSSCLYGATDRLAKARGAATSSSHRRL
jgi:hypothetical protein